MPQNRSNVQQYRGVMAMVNRITCGERQPIASIFPSAPEGLPVLMALPFLLILGAVHFYY
jgi:hypothetical protein